MEPLAGQETSGGAESVLTIVHGTFSPRITTTWEPLAARVPIGYCARNPFDCDGHFFRTSVVPSASDNAQEGTADGPVDRIFYKEPVCIGWPTFVTSECLSVMLGSSMVSRLWPEGSAGGCTHLGTRFVGRNF